MNKEKHTEQEELKAISPYLYGLQEKARQTFFAVPDSYFSSSQNSLLHLHTFSFESPENYSELFAQRIMKHPLISKSFPFQVPEEYFQNLPSRIQMQVQPLASSAFEAPEGYFDRLPYQLQDRIFKPQRREWSLPALRPVLALASLVLIFTFSWLIFRTGEKKLTAPSGIALNKPAVIHADNDLTDQSSELDEDLLIEALQDEKASSLTDASEEKAISDYLIENNVEEYTLSHEI